MRWWLLPLPGYRPNEISDFSDKMKEELFHSIAVPVLLYGHTPLPREKARWDLHKDTLYCVK